MKDILDKLVQWVLINPVIFGLEWANSVDENITCHTETYEELSPIGFTLVWFSTMLIFGLIAGLIFMSLCIVGYVIYACLIPFLVIGLVFSCVYLCAKKILNKEIDESVNTIEDTNDIEDTDDEQN